MHWLYKRVVIDAHHAPVEEIDGEQYFYYFGKQSLMDWKDEEVSQLGREGWELIAAVPLVGGRVKEGTSYTWGVTYTTNICLWFRKQSG